MLRSHIHTSRTYKSQKFQHFAMLAQICRCSLLSLILTDTTNSPLIYVLLIDQFLSFSLRFWSGGEAAARTKSSSSGHVSCSFVESISSHIFCLFLLVHLIYMTEFHSRLVSVLEPRRTSLCSVHVNYIANLLSDVECVGLDVDATRKIAPQAGTLNFFLSFSFVHIWLVHSHFTSLFGCCCCFIL